MTPPGSTTISAPRRVPSETDRMIERMRSDDDEIAASVPSSSLSPKPGNSSGRPPRAPTSVRPLTNNGSKSKSTSRRDRKSKEGDVEEEQVGFMSSVRKAIDASIASATTCLIPGSRCGDIEHGDFDLGRIDDVAQTLYTCGGDGKKTQQAATFDDDHTLFSETQTLDTGYYTGYTGATGLTRGSAASAGRSQCGSTVGRHAYRANANNNDCEDGDLIGDDDDTILEDGNSTGMTRSSTFQTTLTMNTLNSASPIITSGLGSTVGTSKRPTVIAAVRAGDSGGMRYESADMGSSAPVRQRTQSTHRSEKTEPTGSNRSSAVFRGDRESLLVYDGESVGIDLELGKEPKNMPSTAVDIDECSVDIDECSVNDDEVDLDAIGTTVANNESQYNITFVQQNEPLVVEQQSLEDPLASRCPVHSEEIEGTGQEISFDAFKAGLAKSIDANAGGRRNSSEKKKLKKKVTPPPFFAAPPTGKKVPPPPFFASSSNSSRKCKEDYKEGRVSKPRRSTAVKKAKEIVDLDTTAETVDLESCAEI